MSTPFQLIISDLHLCEARADAVKLFLDFLEQHAKKAEALYILGDFFEFWIGDDDLTPLHQKIIRALADLQQSNTTLYFMHGNRDFLLGKRFCHMTHSTLLPDFTVIEPFDHKLLLLHGDALCTDDHRYQRYRKVANLRWLQKLFLMLPLRWRQKIALKLRASNPHTYHDQRPINQFHIADAKAESVLTAFERHQVDTMVHGHTHRYAIHYYPDNKRRIVLGDWHGYGSFIKITPESITLNNI